MLPLQIQLTDSRSSMSRGLSSFQVKKLSTIMKELGHKWVDVLKIDIEGNEWPVLEAMIADKAPFMFTQMQVGHHPARVGFYPCSRCGALCYLNDRQLASCRLCEAAVCLLQAESPTLAVHLLPAAVLGMADPETVVWKSSLQPHICPSWANGRRTRYPEGP